MRQAVAGVVLGLRGVELGVREDSSVGRCRRRGPTWRGWRPDLDASSPGVVVVVVALLEEVLLRLLGALADDGLHRWIAAPLRGCRRRRRHFVPDRAGLRLYRRVAEARVCVLNFVWVVGAEGAVLGRGWRPVHFFVVLDLRFGGFGNWWVR